MGDAQKTEKLPMAISLPSAAVSTIFMHPIETIKGFSAGLLGGLSYSTFLHYYSPNFFLRPFSAVKSTGNAYLDEIIGWSGALALNSMTMSTLVLNPVEVVATRMQGDLALHPDLRRNHKNVLRAMYRAAADEGLLALWRGTGPSVAATLAFGVGFMTSKKCYQRIFHLNDKYSWETRVTALCFLGFVAPPLFSQPFDYVKTQMQMMQPDSAGRYPYTSSLDCARKTLELGGPLKFYSGFAAHCLTRTPQILLLGWLQDKARGMNINVRT